MIETDKSRDVRRGASRFSRQIKQSGHKLISAGLNGRTTSSIEDNYEMGCELADREEALPSQAPSISGSDVSERFKLPRKQFFDDCDGVDPVSVPRKLRSAMKKRNRESLSPPFPFSKLNHSTSGVKSPKRVGIKKPKQNLKQGSPNWSLKQNVGGPITKEEEEVVETLYALAGMFPNIEADHSNKLDSVSLEASPSASPEANESHQPKMEDSVTIKEGLNRTGRSRTNVAVNPASDIERSPEETSEVHSLNAPITQAPSDLSGSGKHHGELDSSIAQVNMHKMAELEEQKPACNLVNFCFTPGPQQDTGKLRQPAKPEILLLDRTTEISLAQTAAIGSQPDQQHDIGKSKNNGPVLWPGLSSTVSSSACHGPLSRSCDAKIPAWLCTRPGINGSIGKVSKVSTDRRSWKRCAAHVYIGCLIRALQMPESKGSLPMRPSKLRPHEILKQGALMTINDFSGIRNYLNGVTSASSIVNAAEKNSNDNNSGIRQHLKLHQDQDHSQAAFTSGAYPCQKKAFNFLSLSVAGGGMEPNSYGTGNGMEQFARLQVPYHAQNPMHMPFSMSQTRFTAAYPDQPSAAAVQQAQLQLSTTLASPYCVPHTSSKALTKQPQQQLWAAQLAAQYGNTVTSAAVTRFPSWPNGGQESPVLMPCIPPSTSTSTLEVLGIEYPQISQRQQHQQEFMAISLPHARMKRQGHLFHSVYEENGIGF